MLSEELDQPVQPPLDIEMGSVLAPVVRTEASVWLYARRGMVYASLPLIAAIDSMSPVAITMLFQSRDASLLTRIIVPLVVWTPFLASSLWVQWYLNGHRADGLLDARVELSSAEAREAPGLLMVALLASVPSFFDAMIFAESVRPQRDALFVMAALVLGIGHELTWCLTVLQAAWRKLSDGSTIKALGEQYWAKPLYDNAYWLNISLREILPIALGLVRAQAFFQWMESWSPFKFLNLLLTILVYQGAALSTRNFEIRQNHDCSLNENTAFNMQGFLAGASHPFLRVVGRSLNGQLLDDAMAKLGLSVNMRTTVAVGLNAAGLVGVLQRVVSTFFLSTNSVDIINGNAAITLHHYASEATTLAISRQGMPASLPIQCFLASVQAYIRAPTIKNQIQQDQRTHRLIQVVVVGP